MIMMISNAFSINGFWSFITVFLSTLLSSTITILPFLGITWYMMNQINMIEKNNRIEIEKIFNKLDNNFKDTCNASETRINIENNKSDNKFKEIIYELKRYKEDIKKELKEMQKEFKEIQKETNDKFREQMHEIYRLNNQFQTTKAQHELLKTQFVFSKKDMLEEENK